MLNLKSDLVLFNLIHILFVYNPFYYYFMIYDLTFYCVLAQYVFVVYAVRSE